MKKGLTLVFLMAFCLFHKTWAQTDHLVWINTANETPENILVRGDNNVVFYGDHIVLNRVEIPEEVVRSLNNRYRQKIKDLENALATQTITQEQKSGQIVRLQEDIRMAVQEAESLNKTFRQIDFEKSAQTYKKAYEAFRSGDFDQAQSYLSDAKLEEGDSKNADTRKLKARLYVVDFKFAPARQEFERAVRIYGSFMNHFDLAYFLRQQTAYGDAEKQFSEALQMTTDSFQRAVVLTNLGSLARAQNAPRKALDYFRPAVNLYKGLIKKDLIYIEQVSTALNNIGNVYVDLDSLAKGESILEDALAIRRYLADSIGPEYRPYLATTLLNLGLLNYRINNYPRAIAYYRQSIAISRAIVTQADNPEARSTLAKCLNNLGNALQDADSLELALPCYKESLQSYTELARQNPEVFEIEVISLQNNLGYFYFIRKEPEDALRYLHQAINRFPAIQNLPPAMVNNLRSTVYHNTGLVYYNLKMAPDTALYYLEQALPLRRAALDPTNPSTQAELGQTLNVLANVYSAQAEWANARAAYEESLSLREKLARQASQVHTLEWTETMINLAGFYKDYLSVEPSEPGRRKALQLLKDALAQLQNFPDHPQAQVQRKAALHYKAALEKIDVRALKGENEILLLAQRLQDMVNIPDSLSTRRQLLLEAENKYLALYAQTRKINLLKMLAIVYEAYLPSCWEVEACEDAQKKAVRWYAEVCDTFPDDSLARGMLAGAWGNLSYYQVYGSHFAEALQSTEQAFRLDSSQTWIKTNAALAYLYLGNWPKAEQLLLEVKDLVNPFSENGETFKPGLLEDLEKLEKLGIRHPDVVKARRLLEGK